MKRGWCVRGGHYVHALARADPSAPLFCSQPKCSCRAIPIAEQHPPRRSRFGKPEIVHCIPDNDDRPCLATPDAMAGLTGAIVATCSSTLLDGDVRTIANLIVESA